MPILFLIQCRLLPSMPLKLPGVCPIISRLRKIGTMVSLTDGSAHYSGTTQKWTDTALQPLGEATLKDTEAKESSLKLQAVH